MSSCGHHTKRALLDRVAIVTGASSGIGAATALELGRRGATVVLAARRGEQLDRWAQAVRAAGADAVAIVTDLADAMQVRSLVDQAMARFGRVDVLVNNAGANWHRPVASTPAAEMIGLVELNLLSGMLLSRAVLPGMLARSHGSIVFVGSLSGRVAMEPVYSATKYGVRGFALALRRQLAGSGVSVSLVSPGNVRTAMNQDVAARLPGPELVAEEIAELIIRPRREVVIPRRHYLIVGLEQSLPGLTDLIHRRRHWSGLTREAPTTWTC